MVALFLKPRGKKFPGAGSCYTYHNSEQTVCKVSTNWCDGFPGDTISLRRLAVGYKARTVQCQNRNAGDKMVKSVDTASFRLYSYLIIEGSILRQRAGGGKETVRPARGKVAFDSPPGSGLQNFSAKNG